MYDINKKKFDFYKFEDVLDFSKRNNSNYNKLIELFQRTNIQEFCDILKAMPFTSDLNSQAIHSKKKQELFNRLTEYIENNTSKNDLIYWKKYRKKVIYLNELIEDFYSFRKMYFDENKTNLELNGELLVVAAELTINELSDFFNPNVKILNSMDNLENRGNIYEGIHSIYFKRY